MFGKNLKWSLLLHLQAFFEPFWRWDRKSCSWLLRFPVRLPTFTLWLHNSSKSGAHSRPQSQKTQPPLVSAPDPKQPAQDSVSALPLFLTAPQTKHTVAAALMQIRPRFQLPHLLLSPAPLTSWAFKPSDFTAWGDKGQRSGGKADEDYRKNERRQIEVCKLGITCSFILTSKKKQNIKQ